MCRNYSPDDLQRAASLLGKGGLEAFPTEIFYRRAADATSEAVVRRKFAVKGRPADHPIIVHRVR
ncbi:MAG: Sua5/YciO/YrdC/YwlC family protein [Pseudomonadota bacterium]|nr:Sua5/YciO/YrdC/YwlC family protein [Pseudomonadota bacterium]